MDIRSQLAISLSPLVQQADPHVKVILHGITLRMLLFLFLFCTNINSRKSHYDHCFAPYAFAWQTLCTTQEPSTGPTETSNPGGHFIDLSLQVTIQCAADSLTIFRPEFLHGTTLPCPRTEWSSIALTFSTHIKTAFDIALAASNTGDLVHFSPE